MQLARLLSWSGLLFQSSSGERNQEVLSSPPSHTAPPPKNYAATIPSEQAQMKVVEVPFPTCGDDELIIENHVVAINPVDWKIQSSDRFDLTYPAILGEDVAGVILEIGSDVKKGGGFHVGQRVMSHALGLEKGSAYGGFQLYPVVSSATVSPIPDDISFSEAAVLPLSISTAAAGLFMKATLGLKYPTIGYNDLTPSTDSLHNPTLLLWGGSSSVGASVIQLATAAGYTVITTASPSNFDFCKNLGADHVIDYHIPDIVSELISLLKGKNVVGVYDAIGTNQTVHQSASVLAAIGGGKIASVGVAPDDLPSGVTIARMSASNIVSKEPEVAEAIWGVYVPSALSLGKLVPSPKALVVGKGLDGIQHGLDRQKEGVSARKIEVLLA